MPVVPHDAVIARVQFSIVGKSDREPAAVVAEELNARYYSHIHSIHSGSTD